MSAPFVIAVDGPAAAGKGTLARRLAAHYGFAHLDTGALYRALGLKLLRSGQSLDDESAAAAAAATLTPADLDDPALREEAAGAAASQVAAMPAVRAALRKYQRDFAAAPPGSAPGAVLDGRDIGTVICPEAPCKLYVDASLEARAERRRLELEAARAPVDGARIRAVLAARDRRDAERADSPLKPAADAHLLDTTNLDIDAAFAAAKAFVDTCLRGVRSKPARSFQ